MGTLNVGLLFALAAVMTTTPAIRGQHVLHLSPSRAVLEAGEDLHLTCTSMMAEPRWKLTNIRTGTTVPISSSTSPRHHVNTTEQEGHFQSDLIISGVTLQDGGVYHCWDSDEPTAVAERSSVVVLGGPPNCTTPPAALVAKDVVTLSCQVQYAGQWRPTMTWSGPQGLIPVTNITVETLAGKVKVSLPVHVTDGMNGAVYTCRTYFNVPRTNPLDYEFTHQFAPLDVLYAPRDVTVRTIKEVYKPGEFVTCSADGNPRPTFEWREEESMNECQGATLLFTGRMEGHKMYSCVATNEIRGKVSHARLTQMFYVHSSDSPASSSSSSSQEQPTTSVCIMHPEVHTTHPPAPTTVKTTSKIVVQGTSPAPEAPHEKPKYPTGSRGNGDDMTTPLVPGSLEAASEATLNYAMLLPVGILAVLLLVGLVATAIYCTLLRSKKKERRQMMMMADPTRENTLNLNNDVYLSTCTDGGLRARCNQYVTTYRASEGVTLGAYGGHDEEPNLKKGDDFDDGSSGFYSELVVPEDKAPEPPALRPGNGHVTNDDAYLLPADERTKADDSNV